MRKTEAHPDSSANPAHARAWELARQQGVKPIKSIKELQGDFWPEDESPVPGVKRVKGARRILLRRYPYSIVLYEHKDEIVIVAFAHNSRRPGYWRLREP